MTGATRQLVFELKHYPALDAEDFIASGNNAAAVELIDRWPDWPSHVIVVAGPEGAGKSHLANVWRRRSDAIVVSAAGLDDKGAVAIGERRAGVIEDIDRGIGAEQTLFHLLNLASEHSCHVLLTGRSLPGDWPIALPDLRSRLRAAPLVAIEAPDEPLLAAVLVKLLADRQLPATPAAISHLARHMERTMAFALRIVEELDRSLWAEPKREITRDLARIVLARLGGEEALS